MWNFISWIVYYAFLQDYKTLAEKLDESSVKLRQSLYSMQAITEMFLQQLENRDMQHTGNEERCTYLAKYLLQTIHHSVVSHRDKMFQLQSELMTNIFKTKIKLYDNCDIENRQETQFVEGKIESFETTIANLYERLELCQKENEEYKKQKEDNKKQSEERINDLKKKLDTLKKENDRLQGKMKKHCHEREIQNASHQSEKEKVVALKSQMQDELKTAKRNMEDLRKEKENLLKAMEDLRSDKEIISSQFDAQTKQLQKQNDEMKSALLKQADEVDALTNEVQSKTKQVKELTLQVKTISDSNERLSKSKNDLLREKLDMEETLNRENANLSAERDRQNDLIKDKSEQIESMARNLLELKRITSKQIINMQVWFNQVKTLTGGIEDELMSRLKSRLDSDQVEIRFKQCATVSDVETEIPLIVICVAGSRIGTDVANAVQGLNLSRNSALVVAHHKDIHALPHQASNRILISSEYKQLGGIFDVAYQSSKGVYDCSMNATNIIGLVNFVEMVGVRRPMFDGLN